MVIAACVCVHANESNYRHLFSCGPIHSAQTHMHSCNGRCVSRRVYCVLNNINIARRRNWRDGEICHHIWILFSRHQQAVAMPVVGSGNYRVSKVETFIPNTLAAYEFGHDGTVPACDECVMYAIRKSHEKRRGNKNHTMAMAATATANCGEK